MNRKTDLVKLGICILWMVFGNSMAHAGGLFYRDGFPVKNSCSSELENTEVGTLVSTYFEGNGVVEYATLNQLLFGTSSTPMQQQWGFLRSAIADVLWQASSSPVLFQALHYLVTNADLGDILVLLPESQLKARPWQGFNLSAASTLFDFAQPGFALWPQTQAEQISSHDWNQILAESAAKAQGKIRNRFVIMINPSHLYSDPEEFRRTWFHELLHIADYLRIRDRIAGGHRPPDLLRPRLENGVWVLPYQWFHFMLETRAYLLNLRQAGLSPLSDEEVVTRYLRALDQDLLDQNLSLADEDSPLVAFGVIDWTLYEEVIAGKRPLDAGIFDRRRMAQLEALYQFWFEKVELERER